RYVAVDALLAQAQKLFRRHEPFMEKAPYCLDFDIVQIVRTGLEQTGAGHAADTARALKMTADMEDFFNRPLPEGYALHKFPGALAAYHECALIAGLDPSGQLGTPAIDIIGRAFWL